MASPITILCVDHQAGIAEALCHRLRGGFRVLAPVHGTAGVWQVLETVRVDVVLLDLDIGGVVVFVVQQLSGAPISGSTLTLLPFGSDSVVRVVTADRDGKVDIGALPMGKAFASAARRGSLRSAGSR